MAYSDKVIEYYENPRNVGSVDKNDDSVGTGLVGAPACGDVMKLQIQVGDDGIIQDARFKTFGCGSAIASSSLATEMIVGRSIDEAMKIKNTRLVQELNLPPVKIHCFGPGRGCDQGGHRRLQEEAGGAARGSRAGSGSGRRGAGGGAFRRRGRLRAGGPERER